MLVNFGGHLGSLGAPFGSILAFLEDFLASCWRRLGSLGASWGAFWAQVGPSRPKIPKKTSIFEFELRKLAQVGTPKSRKIDVKSDVFLRCVFRFWIGFGLQISRFFGSIFELNTKKSNLLKSSSRRGEIAKIEGSGGQKS